MLGQGRRPVKLRPELTHLEIRTDNGDAITASLLKIDNLRACFRRSERSWKQTARSKFGCVDGLAVAGAMVMCRSAGEVCLVQDLEANPRHALIYEVQVAGENGYLKGW
jgi:hypothetical protein